LAPFSNHSISRGNFLALALVFEGGLAAVAFLLGWFTGVNPIRHLSFSGPALAWATAGTIPLALLFLISFRFPFGSLQTIKRLLIETLGPYLNTCRWYDLFFLALLAGVGEELFFRGFLQLWLEDIGGPLSGLLGSNLLFALAHFITRTYALLAGLMGVYLGLLLDAGEQRNLLTPIAVHTAYDFLAFVVVARTFRAERPRK
jgi:uncharacterized protein